MRPTGTGQAEQGVRETEKETECRESVFVGVCARVRMGVCALVCGRADPNICVFSAVREGTRWGPFTPL